jgi:hypothetical protein
VADINWTVSIGGTSFTSITQSLSFSIGRASYFDTPTGNNCTLTVRNNTGQAANISEGDQIIIGSNYATAPLYFYVVEVTFQDEIAANGSTATITGVDALGMLSLFYVNDDPIIGTNNAIRQAVKLANEVYPFVPPYPPPVEYDGRAIVSDAFDPTTIGPRIVDLLLTENSTYYFDGATIEFRTSKAPSAAPFNFTGNQATGLVYYGLTRKYPNANYPNVVNLTSTTVGTTQAFSPSNYERNYNRQVLFNNLAQQQAQTDWFAAVFAQEALYVDIQFNGKQNGDLYITDFLNELQTMAGETTKITYTPPGGTSTTTTFVIEGASISATSTKETNFTLYLSPTVVYDLFTLNSSTFGILNTNRLGW